MAELSSEQEATLKAINDYWAQNAGKPGPQSLTFDPSNGEVETVVNTPDHKDPTKGDWVIAPRMSNIDDAIRTHRDGDPDLDKYLGSLNL